MARVYTSGCRPRIALHLRSFPSPVSNFSNPRSRLDEGWGLAAEPQSQGRPPRVARMLLASRPASAGTEVGDVLEPQPYYPALRYAARGPIPPPRALYFDRAAPGRLPAWATSVQSDIRLHTSPSHARAPLLERAW